RNHPAFERDGGFRLAEVAKQILLYIPTGIETQLLTAAGIEEESRLSVGCVLAPMDDVIWYPFPNAFLEIPPLIIAMLAWSHTELCEEYVAVLATALEGY